MDKEASAAHRRFQYVVWFRNPALPPDDQDSEWPAVLVVMADTAVAAQALGDHLARAYAARVGESVLRSDVKLHRGELQAPVVVDGGQATDAHIGW